jgi:hypothetical protein
MGRRGNNEGSISKRDDGRWMSRITVEGGKRKYFYGDTRQEVAKKSRMRCMTWGKDCHPSMSVRQSNNTYRRGSTASGHKYASAHFGDMVTMSIPI